MSAPVPAPEVVVTVYTRAGCKLCAEAERVAADVAAGVAGGQAVVRLVDIDADAAVRERYTVRVPVVAVDGVELFELAVDAGALRAAVEAAAGRRGDRAGCAD